ncbi:MAG: hypothetical protein A2X23_02450 [Chloroflexi bacterium GWC2_73_18]|nr:MAG: hypothetical protein A2X23_02450 [Chloroflexi bacterium GWC2_73_18]
MATAAGYHHFETVPPREEEGTLDLLPVLRAVALGGLFILAVALGAKIRIDPASCCGGLVSGWAVWLIQVGGFAMTVGLASAAAYHVSGMRVTRLLSDAGSSLLAGALVGALVLPSLPAAAQLGCLLDARCRLPEGWSLVALPPAEHPGRVTLTVQGPWRLTAVDAPATCSTAWGSRTVRLVEAEAESAARESVSLALRPAPDGRVTSFELTVEAPDGGQAYWTLPAGTAPFASEPGSAPDRGAAGFSGLPVDGYPDPVPDGAATIRGVVSWECRAR